jgi:hypothetical protein
MVAVRIRKKKGTVMLELTKLGPVRFLRDDICLLSQKQVDALKGLRIPYEPVEWEEVEEKMKGVLLA